MKLMLRAFVVTLLLALAGCGGGGASGGSGSTPTPGSSTGSLSLGLAGGAPGPGAHVWVTVSAVALHTDANRAWSPNDASWQVLALDAPKVVDLNSAVNGVIASLLTGRSLPAATYGQLRLFVLRHDQPLDDAARQAQLVYNAQVEEIDALGVAHELPLEYADAGLGIRLAGPIVIAPKVDNEFTLQWDAERTLVRFLADDGSDRFTLRPELQAYDLAQTGAIVGLVDQSLFCSGSATSACISHVVASAERPSADGRFMVSVRATPVVPGDTHAAFALYPLPALPAGETFDVVIRGNGMRPMVIRGVPASASSLLAANPTQLGVDMRDPANPAPAPIVPLPSANGDAQVSLNGPSVPPSAQLLFGPTPPGAGALPHELQVANTDPFTGLLAAPQPLPGGDWRVADYAANGVLVFSDAAAQEGTQTFGVMTLGTRYDQPLGIASVQAASGSSVSFTAPVTWRPRDLDVATLTVNLAGGTSHSVDAAEVVVADVGGIVASADASSLIGHAGAQLTLQLPAGPNAAALGATAVYAVSVRSWKRSSPATSVQWTRAAQPVDLRTASPASVTLTLP